MEEEEGVEETEDAMEDGLDGMQAELNIAAIVTEEEIEELTPAQDATTVDGVLTPMALAPVFKVTKMAPTLLIAHNTTIMAE